MDLDCTYVVPDCESSYADRAFIIKSFKRQNYPLLESALSSHTCDFVQQKI